jgi:EAL domain-containing protein (putative c-di-GMP-specific phosphodiesterase class I)
MAGLPRYIEQILEAAELNGKNLKLEITESMIMGNAASIVSVLQEIRSLDIQLAIDDFGTGYSSLSYLTRFPVNTLKIDRSFVSNIGFNSDSLEIIRTIHLLAHNLGMDITAEGVETAEQAACLREMACEFGQGYFFFQPLDADAITTLLAQELNTRPPSPPSIE